MARMFTSCYRGRSRQIRKAPQVSVRTGRWVAEHDDEIVVFLIGMRINRPWKVTKWWPVFTAMPKMVKWLEQRLFGAL